MRPVETCGLVILSQTTQPTFQHRDLPTGSGLHCHRGAQDEKFSGWASLTCTWGGAPFWIDAQTLIFSLARIKIVSALLVQKNLI